MAVRKLKAKKTIDFFLPLMQRELLLPFLVSRFGGEAFKGARGDTVYVQTKLPYKAVSREYDFRGRTAPIVLDDIRPAGQGLTMKLNKHIYSATGLEDEHFTLDEIEFATEVLAPQAEAVAADIEAKALAGFRGAHPKHVLTVQADDDPFLVLMEARRLMSADKVAPVEGRVALVGSDIAAAWAASDRLSRYDSTGQEGTPALREAIIGRVGATTVVEHSGLNPNEGYYFHKSSLWLATVAPAIPRGVTFGQSATVRGIGMRHIQDYDANYLRDRSVVSTFAGVNEIRDERNADGSWIFEEGDLDQEELDLYGIASGDVHPVGYRKNVRVIPFNTTGFGALHPSTTPAR